jgi:hypothetical protein
MLKIGIAVILSVLLFACANSAQPSRSLLITHAQISGNPHVRVWVNTNSGVYHCPGTRWYGNTKEGKYMTQKEAQSKGYRPAYGIICG